MGLARDYDAALNRQLSIRAAWLPITNPFQVGDYGVISNGVFNKLGNISEFGITPRAEPGDRAEIDFSSELVKKRRFEAGAEVNAFSGGTAEGKLLIEFPRENTLVIKAKLNVEQMPNVAQVARQLGTQDHWRRKYAVISAVYSGQDCVVMSARTAGTNVEISGSADALKALDVGNASTGLTLSSNHELGLELNGAVGPLGLKLFKVRGGGDARFLAERGDHDPVDSSEFWPDELVDDI